MRRAPFTPKQRLIEAVSIHVSCKSQQVCAGGLWLQLSTPVGQSSRTLPSACYAPAYARRRISPMALPVFRSELLTPDQGTEERAPTVHCYRLHQCLSLVVRRAPGKL